MNKNILFETLKELGHNQHKKESKDNQDQHSRRKDPSYIYLDEKDNQIKEIPLSKLDSARSVLINKVMKQNSAKLIHQFIFGY